MAEIPPTYAETDYAGSDPEAQAPALTDRGGASSTTGSSVLSAGAWAAASRLLPQVYSLAMSVVAARFLGPEGMGRQSLIAFSAIFATTAATLGVPTALMRFVGERVGGGAVNAIRPLVRAVWRVEAVAAALGAAVLIGVGVHGAEPRAAWVLAGFTCAFGVLQKVPTATLTGLQRWRDASAVTMTMGAVAMVATIAVLAAGGGVTSMIAVGTASTFVILIWTTWRMRSRLASVTMTSQRDAELQRRVRRYAAIASLGVPVTLIVWFRSEFFFLAHYSSDKEIALYSIAFSAYTAAVILPQSLANAIAPAFATLYGARATDRIRQGFARSMRLLLTATLPLTSATMALGPAALRLVYGEEYRRTAGPLLVMLAVLPLVPLLQTSMALLVGVGRQWFPLALGVLAAVVNITLDVILIPRHAALGAATANAVAQIIASVAIVAYAVNVARGITWEGAALCRAAIAAGLSGLAAVVVVRTIGGVAGVALGALVWTLAFCLSARVLHILSASDAAWLEGTLGRRTRRLARFVLATGR